MSSRRWVRPTERGYKEYISEDERVYARHMIDPNISRAVKQRNAELRKTEGAVKTTSFGKLELDIPIQDLYMLDKYFPGLANPRHPDHKWQLRKFMKSPASAPYRLQDQRRANAGHIHVN